MKGSCYYCERPFGMRGKIMILRTKDHIIPNSHGGINSVRNYVPACYVCNVIKGDRTPEQFVIWLDAQLDKKYPRPSRKRIETMKSNASRLILEIAPYRDSLIEVH